MAALYGTSGDDTIADFVSGTDQIDTDATFVDQAALDAAATDVGSDVQIALGGGQILTLQGVVTAGLFYTDFF